jgi:hypothetical protein
LAQNLFISYSRADLVEVDWVGRLRLYLRPFHRDGTISVWDDSKISPGTQWRTEIDNALARTSVAVLLVGPGFLASPFILEHELPVLLRSALARGVAVFPLIVGYCSYRESELGPYQAYNSPDSPLESVSRPEQNRVLNELAIDIAKSLQKDAALGPAIGNIALCETMREMQRHLADTLTAFLAQRRRRDGLVAAIEKRLGVKRESSYEKFFFKYYPQLNDDEKLEFDQIRAITEGPLQSSNRKILELMEKHPAVLDVSPKLFAVRQQLGFWLNKYDRVFSTNPAMCLLYTGDEDGVAFPTGVDDLVEAWITKQCK